MRSKGLPVWIEIKRAERNAGLDTWDSLSTRVKFIGNAQ
jgi:hypothetical protein